MLDLSAKNPSSFVNYILDLEFSNIESVWIISDKPTKDLSATQVTSFKIVF